jgi:hypothetical protein
MNAISKNARKAKIHIPTRKENQSGERKRKNAERENP